MDGLPKIDTREGQPGRKPKPPPASERTVESLGPAECEMKAALSSQGAGFILGLLFTGAAAAITWYIVRQIIAVRGQMPFWADKGFTWGIVLLATLMVFMLGVVGIALLCWVWSSFSFRLYLCPEGFHYVQSGKPFVFAWDEIRIVKETVTHEHVPIVRGAAKYAMPTRTNHSYEVTRKDGHEFVIGADIVKEFEKLAERIKAVSEERGIPWRVTEERS